MAMRDTIYTITGKIQDEQAKPVRNRVIVLFYCEEEVFKDITDEDGYFTYNNDKLKRIYEDTDLFKHLKFTVDDDKAITTDVYRLITRTSDNKELKAIRVHINVKIMRPLDDGIQG